LGELSIATLTYLGLNWILDPAPAIFENLAKSGSGQISSQIYPIWWMSVQLQYV